MRRVGVILLACLLVAACTSDAEPDDSPTEATGPSPLSSPSATPSTSGHSAIAERVFLDREPLPSCGTLELVPAWQEQRDAKEDAREKVECLTRAERTVGAELLVTYYTPEGDPVRRYFRKEPRTYGYYVFTDSTEDNFGSFLGWRRDQCDGLGFSDGRVDCYVE